MSPSGPIPPQLAKSATALPEGEGWAYERKLDGFRAIVRRDGDALEIWSRAGKPLDRYFPELTFPPGRYVLDGEIMIAGADGGEEFGLLSQRIHPAASRIAMLAEETPAVFAAFDLLEQDGEDLMELPWSERRARLEAIDGIDPVETTTEPERAQEWLRTAEGVIAKRTDAPYVPGKRLGMVKIKRIRTVDCVVMAYPPKSSWSNVHDRASRSSRQRSHLAPWRMRPSLAWSYATSATSSGRISIHSRSRSPSQRLASPLPRPPVS